MRKTSWLEEVEVEAGNKFMAREEEKVLEEKSRGRMMKSKER